MDQGRGFEEKRWSHRTRRSVTAPRGNSRENVAVTCSCVNLRSNAENGCTAEKKARYRASPLEGYQLAVAGCSKRLSSKAAGSTTTEAYPPGTSQGGVRLRTLLEAPFNSLRARMIHEDSSRNRRVTWRDRRAEPGRTRSVLVQYVEGPGGEPAGRRLVVAVNRRLQQKRS